MSQTALILKRTGGPGGPERLRLAALALGSLALTAIVAGLLFYRDRNLFAYASLATPLLVVIACYPRAALYQFVFCLFIVRPVAPDLSISLIDASAALLIAAGTLDLLVRRKSVGGLPALTGAFAVLILALFSAAFFAYDFALALVHPTKLIFVLATFLALVRILRSVDQLAVLRVFFWLSVLHSLIALSFFAASGGAMRNFALAPKALDDLLMLSLPMGVALFLGAPKNKSAGFALGSLIMFGGLFVTQSRAPIAFGILGVALVMILASRSASRLGSFGLAGPSAAGELVRRRVRGLVRLALVIGVFTAALQSTLFTTVYDRFGELLTTDPGGSFRLRLTLWKAALTAFADHPLLGVGPSNFRYVESIYSQLRLDPAQIWVRGLSAHSLLLHYLAEAGLVGATAMMALMFKQFRLARANWLRAFGPQSFGPRLGLYVVGVLLVLTSVIEAAWTWGHVSYVAMFFLALSASQARSPARSPSVGNPRVE